MKNLRKKCKRAALHRKQCRHCRCQVAWDGEFGCLLDHRIFFYSICESCFALLLIAVFKTYLLATSPFFFLLPLPSIKKSITKPWQSCETTLPGASKHLMPIISENRLEETEEGRLEGAKSLPRGSNICWQTH